MRSSEAYARLLRKPIRGRTHAFIRLHVHKPGQMPTEQEVVDTDDPVVGEPELDEEAVGEADDNLVQVDAVAPEDNNHTVQAQPVIGNGLAGSNRNDALPVSDDEGDDDAERNDDNVPPGKTGILRRLAKARCSLGLRTTSPTRTAVI